VAAAAGLICGAVSCGTTFPESRERARKREAFRDPQRRARGDVRMNHVERISFAAVRKAWGENRGAEILSAPLMAGWKIAVRKSLDYLRAWPGAAGRQSRKRPFVWTSPRRSRSVQRRRAGKKSLSHWRPALDAVLSRSAWYARGSTCHGTDLSSVQRRWSPARGESPEGR